MTLTFTVAIPTYGRDTILVETLRHVLVLEPSADEVLLVDQTPGHDAATERQLEEWSRDGAIVWIRLEHPSIPHAMNEALRRATSDAVLFLDDDLIPAHDLIARHRQALIDRAADAVVGQILQPGEEPVTIDRRDRSRIEDLGFRFNADEAVPVTNVMAGNLAVRRTRALAMGGFDENFTRTAYRFETDFAWRLADAGGVIWFEPSASIRHLKADRGGLRTWGEHHRSASPAHSTGDYYFALMNLPRRSLPWYVARRMRQSALSRFDLTHPWWIPLKVIREMRALIEAIALSRRGRATISA
jgi:GT2 family glycosyltransferase